MIFQPTYFSPIYQFQKLLKAEKVVFEVFDNYQKQTYRTRLHMYNSNGKLALYIPVKHKKGERQKTRDIQIENSFKWQQNHFRSLQNAYRSSPYFEYYEADLAPLYEKKKKYLLDFLMETQKISLELLDEDIIFSTTENYLTDYTREEDFRFLEDTKLDSKPQLPEYTQVFSQKHGFLPNLSILDLLFNEGPNSLSILTTK